MSETILLVEDEKLLRRSIMFNLEQAGYRVVTVSNAEDALDLVRRDPPDLVLLDIGLPGMDGLEALREMKKIADIPTIFLTARRRELDEALGLELGADDYVSKPFDFPVLLARIKAVNRRTKAVGDLSPPDAPATAGDLHIDPRAATATRAGEPLDLSPREFDLLRLFVANPDRVFSVDKIINQVWGAEYEGQPQVVYVHIRWLREKVEENPDDPVRIITIRGKGYKLVPRN
ncbi:MAG TPA: response regulator transcription factor [Anaerolineales bacterium]|nr:response regulator transcription factor [Anaerolineales bacterium]